MGGGGDAGRDGVKDGSEVLCLRSERHEVVSGEGKLQKNVFRWLDKSSRNSVTDVFRLVGSGCPFRQSGCW